MKIIAFIICSLLTMILGCKFRAWNLYDRFKGLNDGTNPIGSEYEHHHNQPRYDWLSWPPGYPKYPPTEWDKPFITPSPKDCSQDVDSCLTSAIRTNQLSGSGDYGEASQLATAACAEKHNCLPAKRRLCYSFRFETVVKQWMKDKCELWGLAIPSQEVLPSY